MNFYHYGLVCGHSCTLIIDPEYNVHSIGSNDCGKLGHTQEQRLIFPLTKIDSLIDIKMVDATFHSTVCLDNSGNVYSFGRNDKGQLGVGDINGGYSDIPLKLDIPEIIQISCGAFYTICLSYDNELYSFGSNEYGQLGLNHTRNQNTPQLISNLKDIEFVECGGYHVSCKSFNNIYYAWGDNKYYQLGFENPETYYLLPQCCNNWPDNIICVRNSNNHSLLLTSDGYVFSCGSNSQGQLGLGYSKDVNTFTKIKDIPLIKRIECSYQSSYCIDYDNNFWAFGYNTYGQLGVNDTKNRKKPKLSLHNICDISHGGNHTFVKTFDNKIYAFGINQYSNLCKQTKDKNQSKPIQILKDNSDIWRSFIGNSRAKSARK